MSLCVTSAEFHFSKVHTFLHIFRFILDNNIFLLHFQAAAVVSLDETEAVPYADPSNESLSDSLMERFDNMETDETLPERQIVPVTVIKDKNGRLGLKVTGVPSGIYVEDFNVKFVKLDGNMFKKGDRIVAINGRSLENVKYESAVDMMRRADDTVQFLVSQITQNEKTNCIVFSYVS